MSLNGRQSPRIAAPGVGPVEPGPRPVRLMWPPTIFARPMLRTAMKSYIQKLAKEYLGEKPRSVGGGLHHPNGERGQPYGDPDPRPARLFPGTH